MRHFSLWNPYALALVLTLAAGCTPEVPAPTTGTVEGTVTLSGATDATGTQVIAAGHVRITGSDGTFRFESLPPGNIQVRAIREGYVAQEQPVTVSAGATATARLTLQAQPPVEAPNRAPHLAGLSAAPSTVKPRGHVHVVATASDAEGDALEYLWTAPTGWTVEGNGATVKLIAPDSTGQSGLLQLEVRDGKGGTTSGQLVVATTTNQAPVLASLGATPPTVARGGTVTLSASAVDPDGDTLQYAWSAPAGWTLTASGPTATLVAPNASGQSASVQLTVSDATGATASGSVRVSTNTNHGPSIASFSASSATVERGGYVSLLVSASDPDGDTLQYAWSAPAGWTLDAPGHAAKLKAPNAPGQSALILVTVSDDSGASAQTQLLVSTLPNAAPVLTSLTATPASTQRGGQVSVKAFVTDADDAQLQYEWSAPAGWTLSGTGPDVSLTAPATPGASGTLLLVVKDGAGGTTSGALLVSTLPNQVPVVHSLSATPSPVAPGGTVALLAHAVDGDGDSLQYTWNVPTGWTVEGSGAAVTLRAPQALEALATVSVTVSDSFGGSAQASVSVTTRENRPPVLASVSALPSTVSRGGTVALRASAQDPDGDTLVYAWSVSGEGWNLSGTGPDVSLTAPNASGQLATVTVHVTDGRGGSVSGAVSVSTQANQAPLIFQASTEPSIVLPGARLNATVAAIELDAEPLSYLWTAQHPGWLLSASTAQVQVTAPFENNASTVLQVQVSDGVGGTASTQLAVSTSACPTQTMNCDRDPANGCEASLASDAQHCGACGNVCPAETPACVEGVCSPLYLFTGIRNDVPVSTVTGGGWQECYRDTYNTNSPLSDVFTACSKARLMLACRPTGSPMLRVLAHAPREDVLFDTGTSNTPHVANGVGWYFSSDRSWGFAPEGKPIQRDACDVEESSVSVPAGGPTAHQRLCWHTSSDSLGLGWRCGDIDGLNYDTSYERIVYQAD
jgi:predicted secreted protein/protocatechuate 3,4-dioxygenase beta subunit